MAGQRRHIQFVFRGRIVRLDDFAPGRTLLDWLRRDQRAYGVKEGCAEGDCGACTVMLRRWQDGAVRAFPVNACILLLGQADGAEILTIEDLAVNGALHPVQDALVRHHGSQCGFCTPGIAMSLAVLHGAQQKALSRSVINDALAGNLCRCTGYRPIVDAMIEANRQPAQEAFSEARRQADAMLQTLDNNVDIVVECDGGFFASPASEDSLAKLALAHPDAHFLGGATDFALRITKEMFEPRKIIWLARVRELQNIHDNGAGLTIGASVTIAQAMQALGSMDADIAEMLRRFGSMQVRASGTVGGNIANGSPVGDLPPLLIALGAELELRRDEARRRMPLEDFFLAYRNQDRQPGEFVSAVHVPALKAQEQFRAFKLSKRFDEDISAVCFAMKITRDDKTIIAARIACGAMAGTPARARKSEGALAGVKLDEENSWQAALAALDEDFTPMTDQRASAAYRRETVRNLLYKALLELSGQEDSTRIRPRKALKQAAE